MLILIETKQKEYLQGGWYNKSSSYDYLKHLKSSNYKVIKIKNYIL